MDEQLIKQEFERLENYYFDKANWQPVQLTRAWAKSLPDHAGVYMMFDHS